MYIKHNIYVLMTIVVVLALHLLVARADAPDPAVEVFRLLLQRIIYIYIYIN